MAIKDLNLLLGANEELTITISDNMPDGALI